MPEPVLPPLQRLALAFYAFAAVLSREEVAAEVFRIRAERRPLGPARAAHPEPPPAPHVPGPPAAHATVPARPVEPFAPPGGAAPAARPQPVPPPPASAGPAPVVRMAEPLKVAPARAEPPRAEPAKPEPPRQPDPVRASESRSALQLLSALQREGRLVDFIEEDLAGFPDSSIGAAARTVHAGCKRAIQELFRLEPIFREAEGAAVTVAAGFDPAAVRLTGKPPGKPPFQGALRHHGWRVREVKLPAPGEAKDPGLLAPAEVEL